MEDALLIEQGKYLIKILNNKIYITNKNTGHIYDDQIEIKTILWENNKNIYKYEWSPHNTNNYHDISIDVLNLISETIKNNSIKEFYQYIN